MKTKKVILTLLMAMAFSLNGVAQKGMNGIGINIPVGTGDGFTWVGIGVKYQYNISDYFRIEPSFEYSPVYSKKDYLGVVDDYNYIKMNAFLNGHIFSWLLDLYAHTCSWELDLHNGDALTSYQIHMHLILFISRNIVYMMIRKSVLAIMRDWGAIFV